MSAVKQVFGRGLTHRVVLYMPGTTHVVSELKAHKRDDWNRMALRLLSLMFGGATASAAQGGWVTNQRELVVETVTVVFSFTSSLSIIDLRTLYKFADLVRLDLGQEAVAVEIDGELFFV